VGAIVLFLSACGGNEQKNMQSQEPPPPELSKDPVDLLFFSMSGWTEETFNERFGDSMRKKFPHYNIRYIPSSKTVTIESLIAAGETIDVYWDTHIATFSALHRYQMQYDMSELIKKHKVNLDLLDQAALNISRTMSNGGLYALPLVNNTTVLYYNKDIFDKFGVSYPKDGMMMHEVLELAKRLNRDDGGTRYYGIGSYPSYFLSQNPFSIPYIDARTEKPTILSDPRWKTIYEYLIAAFHTADNKSLSDTNAFVRDKNAAMFLGLANLFLNFDVSGMNWDLAAFPQYKEAPGVEPQTLPTMFAITSMSKHPNEAMAVLAHILSEEEQKALAERAIMPILRTPQVIESFGKKAPYPGKNYAAIFKYKFAESPPLTGYDTKAKDIYLRYVGNMANGTMDFNTAFRKIEEETLKMIAAEKN
jgi:multiple sugar transport system substrate-binding protein